jgi:hypothetical protein
MKLRDEDFDNVNPGEPRFLLQEGAYPAEWVGRESKIYKGWGEKVIFLFKVFTSSDKSRSVTLSRYYNAQRDGGNRFIFGPLHDLRKDWIAANRGKLPLENYKLSLSIWKDKMFLVDVATVRHDSKGRQLAPSLHWSKVSRVLRPMDEDEKWDRLPMEVPNNSK